MFNKEFRKSIRFQFLVLLLGFLILGSISICVLVAVNENKLFHNSLRSKGDGFASYIAKLSKDPLIMKDSIQMDAIVNEINKDGDVSIRLSRTPPAISLLLNMPVSITSGQNLKLFFRVCQKTGNCRKLSRPSKKKRPFWKFRLQS